MKNFCSDIWNSYWPELTSFAVAVVFFIVLIHLNVTQEVLENAASLAAQVLGTYLGLALTTFAIYHGMNLKEVYSKIGENKNLSPGIRVEIEQEVVAIGKEFLVTISTIAIGVVFAFTTYIFCLLGRYESMFAVSNPTLPNSLLLSLLIWLVAAATLSVVETVRTILILRV